MFHNHDNVVFCLLKYDYVQTYQRYSLLEEIKPNLGYYSELFLQF